MTEQTYMERSAMVLRRLVRLLPQIAVTFEPVGTLRVTNSSTNATELFNAKAISDRYEKALDLYDDTLVAIDVADRQMLDELRTANIL